MRASLPRIFQNYVCIMSLTGLAWLYYHYNPHYQQYFSSTHRWPWFSVSDQQLLNNAFWVLAVVFPFYYATLPDSHVTKSRLVWRALAALPKRLPTAEEKIALLATAVKFFFLPLMLAWFFANGANFLGQVQQFWSTGSLFPHGYWMVFYLILFIDVAFFLLAYTVEHPGLHNEIRSVDPTLLGWVVALLCYPPFNGMTNQVLGWYSSDYPGFQTAWLQYVAGSFMLVLMTIYVWATVALNLKASNLTHRGIVTHGPYAYIRHPAYLAKNLAWWVGALPILARQYQQGFGEFLFALFCVLTWSLIYYLRAITEERHLSFDPVYREYCSRVPRFLPARLLPGRSGFNHR